MKPTLLLLLLVLGLSHAEEGNIAMHGTEKVQKSQIFYGKILEIKPAMGYKYLRVNEEGKEVWIAIAKAPVTVGDKIGYDKATAMPNFKSKTLNQTFKEIFFVSDLYLPNKVQKPKSMKEMLDLSPKKQDPHANMEKWMSPTEKNDLTKAFVQKDTYTVEEIHMWRESLEGQNIAIEASVSKVSHEIMELDWVHLNDGTGNEEKLTNDLVLTAKNTTIKAGDKVLAKGTVVVNKDFGFGYFYKVIIQDATFQVK